MKHIYRKSCGTLLLLFVVAFVVALSGCQSMQDKLEELFSGSTENAGSGSAGTPLGKPQDQQGTAIRLQPLPVPASYDKAYSHRTDVADKAITAFLKKREVDSLRSSNPTGWLRAVVEEINRVAQDDFEKAKLAHDVTAVLISYDAESFWSGSLPGQDFASVIKSKKAVCEGYAAVYQKLCDSLKIPCKTIHGYARGVGTNLAQEGDVKHSNHAWNRVQLEGSWYLVDCTWDSGHMEGKTAKQSYTTDWLFLRPEHYIHSHFPEQQRDQLLASPVSAGEFSELADLRPKFFQVATEVAPLPVKTNAVDGTFELGYQEQDGCQLSFTLRNLDTGRAVSNAVMVQRTGEHKVRAAFSFPAAGLYEVTVFYHKNGSRQGTSCGQFLVQANRAGTVQYPALSPADGVQVLAPLTMPLASGREVLFQVAAPQKKFVALIYGRTYIQLERDGKGNFSAKVSVPRNVTEVSLGVANSERGSYQVVATYKVQ